MNDTGLLLIHKFAYGTKITPQNFEAIKLANTLFEDCLDKEERERLWQLLYDKSMQHYVEHIDDYISATENLQLNKEDKS